MKGKIMEGKKLSFKDISKGIINNIFSIKNSDDKIHNIITILGIRLSIKKRIKFPIYTRTYNDVLTNPQKIEYKHKRAAIFATFDINGLIHDNTIKYLTEIKRYTDYIVIVADNPVNPNEISKINNLADAVLFKRHGEYDFGSYKRGYLKLKELEILDNIESLLFFNDSVIYEGNSLFNVFEKSKNNDYFGLIANNKGTHFKNKYYYNFHIQSWFFIVSREIFNSKWFEKFISSIKKEKHKREIIIKYEMGLSKLISEQGYKINSYYPINSEYDNPDIVYTHPDKNFKERLFIKKRFLNK